MSISRCLNGLKSRVCTVLGSQWGDEGKGKLVGMLSDDYDISARFNGGANAGHTIVKDGQKYAFHLIPSSIVSPKTQNLLGNGVVVNIPGMFKELSQLDKRNLPYDGRILISDRAHLVTDYQLEEDASHESKQNLGTTKKGIGPTYAAKIQRYGLRAGDLLDWDSFLTKYQNMGSFYPKKSL
jgi:adenylosuccinate synthase